MALPTQFSRTGLDRSFGPGRFTDRSGIASMGESRTGTGSSLLPDVGDAFKQFTSMFPRNFNATGQLEDFFSRLPSPTRITAPQIDIPNLETLRENLFEAQFRPQEREINRATEQQQERLSSRLAQTGLAESGAGVGQQARLDDQAAERLAQASRVAANQAAADAAKIDVQRAMAQAGFDFNAQRENARNLLEEGRFKTSAFAQALGIDERAASAFRSDFIDFLDDRTRAELDASELSRRAASDLFARELQQQAVAQRLPSGPLFGTSTGGGGSGRRLIGPGTFGGGGTLIPTGNPLFQEGANIRGGGGRTAVLTSEQARLAREAGLDPSSQFINPRQFDIGDIGGV